MAGANPLPRCALRPVCGQRFDIVELSKVEPCFHASFRAKHSYFDQDLASHSKNQVYALTVK